MSRRRSARILRRGQLTRSYDGRVGLVGRRLRNRQSHGLAEVRLSARKAEKGPADRHPSRTAEGTPTGKEARLLREDQRRPDPPQS